MEIEERTITQFRAICNAQWEADPDGCSGASHWCDSRADVAMTVAEDRWQNRKGRIVCPSHVRAADQEGNHETR